MNSASSAVKTAVSLPSELFKKGDQAAAELGVTRSRLFAMVLEDFLRQRENLQMLKEINEAYSAPLDEDERATLRAFQRSARRIIERSEQ